MKKNSWIQDQEKHQNQEKHQDQEQKCYIKTNKLSINTEKPIPRVETRSEETENKYLKWKQVKRKESRQRDKKKTR